MESEKLSEAPTLPEGLISLQAVTTRVQSKADRYLPDFRHDYGGSVRSHYGIIPLAEWTKNPHITNEVGLYLQNDGEEEKPYLFTDWSRSQLLTLLGVRELWFSSVSLEQQADELNKRIHVLGNYRVRLEKAEGDDFDARYVRGIVSPQYAEITDVHIMEQLTEGLRPPVCAIEKYTAQTDRASYTYLISPESISLTGTSALPGILVKNSEVGFTSLWVHLFIYFPLRGYIAVKPLPLLRRVHRGSVLDLHKKFAEAQASVANLWESIECKIELLRTTMLPGQSDAIAMIENLCDSSGASKLFTLRCRQAYEKAHHQTHTAYTVFEAVASVANVGRDVNQLHVNHTVAGAVLFKLIQ